MLCLFFISSALLSQNSHQNLSSFLGPDQDPAKAMQALEKAAVDPEIRPEVRDRYAL